MNWLWGSFDPADWPNATCTPSPPPAVHTAPLFRCESSTPRGNISRVLSDSVRVKVLSVP
jgi:hypothetical protein